MATQGGTDGQDQDQQWTTFDAFRERVDRPRGSVYFALQALQLTPRADPRDRRRTLYDLGWAERVRRYIDELAGGTYTQP
jgi:hypothetical protein